MNDIFVTRRDDQYVALKNKRVIATGDTQAGTVERTRRIKQPDDVMLAERVNNTKSGSRDKWRRVY